MADPKRTNYVPEHITITMEDFLILYVNLHAAKDTAGIGVANSEKTFRYTWNLLRTKPITLPTGELEALFWACVHLEELPHGSRFYHPYKLTVNQFIQKAVHHKTYRFYFDKIYNFFRSRKPKQGTPEDMIVEIRDRRITEEDEDV